MMCLSDNELQMLADNALDQESCVRALAHIKGCAYCQEQYAQIQSVFAFLESEPAVGLPAGFAEAVAARATGTLVSVADTRSPAAVAQQSHVGRVGIKRMQKSAKDVAIAIVVIVALSALLNWLSSNSLGTVVDTLSYDLDTVDIPLIYAMLLFTLAVGVIAVDVLMYRRFNRLNVIGRDRQ